MNHGKVEVVGVPHEVYERPATPFVYGLSARSTVLSAVLAPGMCWVNTARRTTTALPRVNWEVEAHIRPHELQIDLNPSAPGLPATVERVRALVPTPVSELLALTASAGGRDQPRKAAELRLQSARLRPRPRGSACSSPALI